jgi:hypothetical protein
MKELPRDPEFPGREESESGFFSSSGPLGTLGSILLLATAAEEGSYPRVPEKKESKLGDLILSLRDLQNFSKK